MNTNIINLLKMNPEMNHGIGSLWKFFWQLVDNQTIKSHKRTDVRRRGEIFSPLISKETKKETSVLLIRVNGIPCTLDNRLLAWEYIDLCSTEKCILFKTFQRQLQWSCWTNMEPGSQPIWRKHQSSYPKCISCATGKGTRETPGDCSKRELLWKRNTSYTLWWQRSWLLGFVVY